MKIKLTYSEINAMASIYETIGLKKEDVLAGFKKYDCGIMNINPLKKEVEIKINEDFILDIYEMYGKYIPVFVTSTKAIVDATIELSTEAESLIEKYYKEEDNKAEKTEEATEEPVGSMEAHL